MFQYILQFNYADHTLGADETTLLKLKVEKMSHGLVTKVMGPVDLSIDQNSPRWLLERRIRITASVAKSFYTSKKLDNIVNDHLWKTKDLGNIKAIQYGRDNEVNAFNAYKIVTGFNVCKAGLVVNNQFPGLGWSVDGLVYDVKDGSLERLIEIKCPYKIRDIHPKDFAPIDTKKCATLLMNKIT